LLLRRPRLALLLVGLLTLVMLAVANVMAQYDTAPDTIVDPGSQAFRHEVQFENAFGADPLVVLVTGNVRAILNGTGLVQLANIEGTLVLPANRQRGVLSLYGPTSIAAVSAQTALGTLQAQLQAAGTKAQTDAYNQAKAQGKSDADAQAAGQAAAQAAEQQYLSDALKQYPELQQIGLPSETNPLFVSAIFLDKSGNPKARFNAVVPDQRHIVITARLSPGTSSADVNAIVASVRDAARKGPIPNATVTVSGAPVLEAAVERALRVALFAGMLAGLVSMAILMLLAFRRRLNWWIRLVPVAAGLATAGILAGTISLVGFGVALLRFRVGLDHPAWQSVLATFTLALNPATLAALPIATGLSVDYAVQFLARYRQAQEAGVDDALAEARAGAGSATRRALLCTAAGLLALFGSAIPMVRQFGLVMILGAGLAWWLARTTVLAAVRVREEPRWLGRRAQPAPTLVADGEEVPLFGMSTVPHVLPPPAGGGAVGGSGGPLRAWLLRLASPGLRTLAAVLTAAFAVAAVGWIAFPFSTYETDPEKLVSPDLPAFRDVIAVRQATGSSGELDFVVTGPDVTTPAALTWQRQLLQVAQSDSGGQLKPLANLAQFVTDVTQSQNPTADDVRNLLAAVPSYFTSALATPDRTIGRVAFGVTLAPVQQQKQWLDRIQGDISPPAGFTLYPAGLTALSIVGLESLEAGQVPLNLAAAGLVLLALLLVYRRERRFALLAWLPTLLVAGWSTAVLFALRAPLTPMTGVLGALVVAFGSEFGILWLERFREAAAAASPGPEAARAASAAAGPGIMTSAAALVLGFLALTVGGLPLVRNLGFDLPMLRDFGLVAAMDMVLAVVAVLVVLPPLAARYAKAPARAVAAEPPAPVSSPARREGAGRVPAPAAITPAARRMQIVAAALAVVLTAVVGEYTLLSISPHAGSLLAVPLVAAVAVGLLAYQAARRGGRRA